MAITWNLDKTHSEIEFKVKHLMISNVKGTFNSFDIEVDGEDLMTGKVIVTIDAASIDTNNNDRDAHLKGSDFFDVDKYPSIVFTSKSFSKVGNEYQLKGELKMKDVSKEIVLNVEAGGATTDPWGNEKSGFSISGKINRKEWGLNWNAALEAGGVMVSDEVKLNAEVQFVKKA